MFTPGDADRVAATTPHARIIEVPGAGHTVHGASTRAAYLAHLDASLAAR